VNLASRLEHEALVGGILITSDTYVLVKDEIKCTAMGSVDVRGMAYPVETYKVIDLIENLPILTVFYRLIFQVRNLKPISTAWPKKKGAKPFIYCTKRSGVLRKAKDLVKDRLRRG